MSKKTAKSTVAKLSLSQLLETGFSTAKSAKEAAEAHFGAKWETKAHVTGDKSEGFYVRKGKGATPPPVPAAQVPLPPPIGTVEDTAPKAKKTKEPATEPATEAKEIRHKTVALIAHPVEYVWEYCTANKDKTRKEILAHLDGVGIAYHTARTQYQCWRKAGSEKIFTK